MMKIPDDKAPLMPVPGFFADGWRSDDVPEEGAVVTVCAEDWRGVYALPFPVRFQDDEWVNATTGEALACFVAGWKERS